MPHVFISYHQDSDGDFVAAVQLELQRGGFEVWTDREIEAGHAWQEKIDAAIRDALALVVVLSPGGLQSAYVAYEWAFALGAGVRVIPLLRKVDPAALHARLCVLDVLDFSNDRIRPWAELLDALRSAAQQAQDPGRALRAGVSDAVRTAARALDSVHEAEREAALASLEQMTDPGANEVLANALGHPVRAVRYRAACLLGGKGDARAIDMLVAMLIDPEYTDLGGPFQAFSQLGADALPKLDVLCQHANEYVRRAAVSGVGTIDPARAVERLVAASRDASAEVRWSAVEALGRAGDDPRAAAAVLRCAEDADASVRTAAAVALGRLGGDEALESLARLSRDPDRSPRVPAIAALGTARCPAAVQALVAAADTDDGDTRRLCAAALGTSGRPEAIPVLLEMVRDPESLVSQKAWAALERFEDPRATEALLALLEDPDLDVRRTAATRLASRGDHRAADGLVAALARADDRELIRACCQAIGALRAEGAVSSLVTLLGHDDPKVVEDARRALDRIGTPEARQVLAAIRKRGR